MCVYYRCFIAHFSSIAGPLNDYTTKNVRFVWSHKKEEAFKMPKEKLILQPILVLPDLEKPFKVQCDACGHRLGGLLLEEGHAIA